VATITEYGDVRIEVDPAGGVVEVDGTILDTIQLSIFSHRFMSIAEQMGRILQRTSISTNIKERLDFSCALFGPDGGLVANAPHIPVHLGAMQEAVQYQMQALGDDIHEGDVIASNHPAAGGCHLPDITVITPVFYPGHPKPMFYVANRGHHADIGGITPGSMPPNSRYLWEEGMQVKTFKLVTKGIFQEDGMTQLLMEPAKYPGCSGTRNLHDNISDLRAQVAANLKGINLVKELISFYGMSVTMAYMNYIQENAEVCVRDMLREISKKAEKTGNEVVLSAEDHLDDSSPLKLKVTIEEDKGSAVFDFTGTGPQVPLNLNAPKSITRSAVLYCLRCMVGHDVPLNQGCLKPITFIIPEGSFLDPSDEAAVIGGNVLTSQRLTDVVFKAFKVCAASQGCMNNTTFGNESFGYYETVAGGAGAGPTWHGRSGVHTHMTNTRITDPEILERRYPVILNKFHLNKGTGGRGLFQGGDGVLREMMFRTQLTLSVLSERRVYRPYGLEGGEPGALGRNTLIRKDNSVQDIGGKATVSVYPGVSG
jgi:5-oxoprolinase (ATP-hydrolysing)